MRSKWCSSSVIYKVVVVNKIDITLCEIIYFDFFLFLILNFIIMNNLFFHDDNIDIRTK